MQLGSCNDAAEMTRVTGEGLDQLFQPLGCAVYVRAGDRFAPAFHRGFASNEDFAEDDPLIATLERRSEPIGSEELSPGNEAPGVMEHFDFAVLQTLGVPLVVPVRRDGRLVAFVCLGGKRSGDVYTATDRALLAIAADKVSTELSRLDQGALLVAARKTQERLRSYVPGSLADELDRGRELRLPFLAARALLLKPRHLCTQLLLLPGQPPRVLGEALGALLQRGDRHTLPGNRVLLLSPPGLLCTDRLIGLQRRRLQPRTAFLQVGQLGLDALDRRLQ